MGADPWMYFVPYQPDIQAAMETLQHEVFATAAYRFSERNPRTIDEARAIAAESGTASILDMYEVADEVLERSEGGDPSEFDLESLAGSIGRIHGLDTSDLKELFGTSQPTREIIKSSANLYHWLNRGVGVYIVAYADGKPSEICFAGYSFD